MTVIVQDIITRQAISDAIAETLSVMIRPGQVVELRILKVDGKKNRTDSGYFSDMNALASNAAKYNGRANIYFTPNSVDPALLARASNRVNEWAEGGDTTSDLHITRRHWLLIDADPDRPTGISSTDAEHQAAIERIEIIAAYLDSRGWPKPIIASSGNGGHANYFIDLPNTPENTLLVQRCLLALSMQFTDDVVKVDTGNFNPGRIWKLYGTKAVKGDDTEDRPHRYAKILSKPTELKPVTIQQLQALANLVPEQNTKHDARLYAGSAFDLESWMATNNITGQKAAWNGGNRWRLDKCYFSDAHEDGAFIVQMANGAIAAGCKHTTCQGKNWHDLRAIFDGPKEQRSPKQQGKPVKKQAQAKSQQDSQEPSDHEEAQHENNQPSTWPYGVEAGCVVQYVQAKNSLTDAIEINAVPLCNFNAWIIADIETDDGSEITRRIAIAGHLATGEILPEIEIDADDFETLGWVVAKWGAKASIQPGRGTKDVLRHAIQKLSENQLQARRVYTHTGWRIVDNQRIFLHAAGAIGSDNVSVKLPPNLTGYIFPSDDQVSELDAMRNSIALLDIAPIHVSGPLWADMYLAPLSEIVSPAFVDWIEGRSGSLKSSYSGLMLSHYGKTFDEYHMPADWLSTANSLEKLTFHAKDVPLIIDDFRPVTNRYENLKMQDSASRIVRASGNRQGRGRLDGDSEFKRTFAPRGVVISTAERGALGQSTNARLLTVTVEPGDIDPAKLAAAQALRGTYAYAMRGYIKFVGENWKDLETDLPDLMTRLRLANGANTQHRRLPGAISAHYTGFYVAMEYAQHIGAITKLEAERRMTEIFTALQDIAEHQSSRVESQDPAEIFLRILVTLLVSERAQILARDGKHHLGANDIGLAERLGWHDGMNIYILPTAINAVHRYLATEGTAFPADENDLRESLRRRGWISESEEGRGTVLRRDPGNAGKQRRVTALSMNALYEYAKSMGIDTQDLRHESHKGGLDE